MKTKQRRKDRQKNFWGLILPCMGCVCFLPVKELDIRCSTGVLRKSLPGNRENFPDAKRAAGTIRNRGKGLHYVMKRIKNQRKDFHHKLSHDLAEKYDAVCVEDLNLKGIAGGLHFGKRIQDNGYGQFLSMLGYKLEERGKYLIKVDRYFASSKICSVCGNRKKELALSERTYICECGNWMDRDVNAAVNILKEGKKVYKKCA